MYIIMSDNTTIAQTSSDTKAPIGYSNYINLMNLAMLNTGEVLVSDAEASAIATYTFKVRITKDIKIGNYFEVTLPDDTLYTSVNPIITGGSFDYSTLEIDASNQVLRIKINARLLAATDYQFSISDIRNSVYIYIYI